MVFSPEFLPRGANNNDAITAGICGRRNGVQGSSCTAAILSRPCPLWVKSRHRIAAPPCPLYPQKRTSEATLLYVGRSSYGSLAIFAAIRRASSLLSSLAAERRFVLVIDVSELLSIGVAHESLEFDSDYGD